MKEVYMKKIPLLTILFCLFIPIQTFAFSDIENNTHQQNILYLQGKNIINGYEDSTFRPNEPITRAQALKMMYRLYGQTDLQQYRIWQHAKAPIERERRELTSDITFTDFTFDFNKEPIDYELYDVIERLYSLNVLNGYPDGSLRLSEPMKRMHLAMMLQKLFLLPNEPVNLPFTDVKGSNYKQAIQNLYTNGITAGSTSNTFSPHKTMTRGQFASFIARTHQFINNIEMDMPVRIISNKRYNYEEDLYEERFILLNEHNAKDYGVTAQQLESNHYIARIYVTGGCGIQIAGFTHKKDAGLDIIMKAPVQVLDSIYACTADIRIEQQVLQVDLQINSTNISINGKKIIYQ